MELSLFLGGGKGVNRIKRDEVKIWEEKVNINPGKNRLLSYEAIYMSHFWCEDV